MGPAALGHEIGVAALKEDIAQWEAQEVAQDLAKGGFVSLALRLCARDELELSVSVHSEANSLDGCPHGRLDIIGQSDATQFATGQRDLLPLRKVRPVGHFNGLPHVAGKTPTVIAKAHRGAVGQLVVLDQIDFANVKSVQFEFVGCDIEHAFHHMVGLRSTRTSVGAGGHGVGVDELDQNAGKRNVIDGGHDAHAV